MTRGVKSMPKLAADLAKENEVLPIKDGKITLINIIHSKAKKLKSSQHKRGNASLFDDKNEKINSKILSSPGKYSSGDTQTPD